MPCYDAAATLPDALDSLLAQTLQDFEIVAVDDGSSDDTPAILRTYARREPRLSILTQAHAGLVASLNTGLAACRAQIIARMDADDRSHPERLARQLAFLQANPQVALLACRVQAFPDQDVRQGLQGYLDWQNSLCSDADIRRQIFIESPFTHPSVAIRRVWLLRLGGYQDHGWAEDYDLWLRLYLAGAQFAKLDDVLLEWRERPQRLTRTDSRYSLENFLRAKAHYLLHGPLSGRDAVFLWGAGIAGRRLGRQLLALGVPLVAYFDIAPRKIGSTRHGRPVLPPQALLDWWARFQHPVLLATVGARNARPIVRQRLVGFGLQEGLDWWGAA